MSALTASHGGADDNDAQAGHLVYVKSARSGAPAADGSLPPETWLEGGVSPTMNTFDNGDVRATVLAVTGEQAHALTSEGADASEDGTGRGTPTVTSPTGVRRLTPVECERLQGFPDGWTALRDQNTPQADSSRYRQLGNAVAVPVVEWILGRVVAADVSGVERGR